MEVSGQCLDTKLIHYATYCGLDENLLLVKNEYGFHRRMPGQRFHWPERWNHSHPFLLSDAGRTEKTVVTYPDMKNWNLYTEGELNPVSSVPIRFN